MRLFFLCFLMVGNSHLPLEAATSRAANFTFWICPDCKWNNLMDHKYCYNCGTAHRSGAATFTFWICPECKWNNLMEHENCYNCGTPLR